ncbi:apolipoprotein L3-like, partial [Pimephales promelas]
SDTIERPFLHAISLKGTIPTISNMYSGDLRELISQMLSRDPHERPSADEILEKPFLEDAVERNRRIPDALKCRLLTSIDPYSEYYKDFETVVGEWETTTDSLEEIHHNCTIGSLTGSVIGAAGGITAGAISAHWLKTRVPRRARASGRLCLKVTQNCITALEPCEAVDRYQTGVNLGVISKLKVVSTDASNSGWGALYKGRPTFGLWSSQEKSLHINCLEMKAVENALRFFLPFLKGHHVLVRTDNMSVVSYINRQGGLRSQNPQEQEKEEAWKAH